MSSSGSSVARGWVERLIDEADFDYQRRLADYCPERGAALVGSCSQDGGDDVTTGCISRPLPRADD
jgi:hypothetical protein